MNNQSLAGNHFPTPEAIVMADDLHEIMRLNFLNYPEIIKETRYEFPKI
jgi:hypothetical protein